MKDHIPGYTPQTRVSDRQEHLSKLSAELEASADRICDYQDQLMKGITALKSIEYDRLLDEYRAELVRYDNIDRELRQLEDPTKTKECKSYHRNISKQQKNKINY